MTKLVGLEAFHMALDMAKKAGFVLANASQSSTTCYYRYPGHTKLLRISDHRSSKSRIGFSNVAAKVAFPPKDRNCYESSVHKKMVHAIGLYFLTEPSPSEYLGKRGTWSKTEIGSPSGEASC